jgi:four helix bundle protein
MHPPVPARRPLRSYQELFVWQRAMDLVVACYAVTRVLPPCERFELSTQLRRAVVSVPANIAEGYGRVHRAEYAHHVSIARGSLKETETHLLIARRLRYITDAQLAPPIAVAAEVGRLITRLLAALQVKDRA